MNNKGFVLWFTGLSGAGKSSIADASFDMLKSRGVITERLDGDVVRDNLTRDLGFSKQDRDENIRRIAFVADILARNRVAVIASFISPYQKQRDNLRTSVTNYIEVFVNTPLEVCEKRDNKGLYKKARQGEIDCFTGISDPYEPPKSPEIELKAGELGVEECAEQVLSFLENQGYI